MLESLLARKPLSPDEALKVKCRQHALEWGMLSDSTEKLETNFDEHIAAEKEFFKNRQDEERHEPRRNASRLQAREAIAHLKMGYQTPQTCLPSTQPPRQDDAYREALGRPPGEAPAAYGKRLPPGEAPVAPPARAYQGVWQPIPIWTHASSEPAAFATHDTDPRTC